MDSHRLSVADSLRLFDSADALRLNEAANPGDRHRLAQAFQDLSADQGVPVSVEFAERVVNHALDPSLVPHPETTRLWSRPLNTQAWEQQCKALREQLAQAKRTTRRMAVFACGVGLLVFLATSVFASEKFWTLPHHQEGFLGVFLCAILGMLAATVPGSLASAGTWALLHSLKRRSKPTWSDPEEIEMSLLQLEPAELTERLAVDFAKVPGMAACLIAILGSSVPFLNQDRQECLKRLDDHKRSARARWQEREMSPQREQEKKLAVLNILKRAISITPGFDGQAPLE